MESDNYIPFDVTLRPMEDTLPKRDIYSVSRLNAEIRSVLEGSFPLVWVEGEISNLATPRSGHSYFSLKDAHAQVRCALFRNRRLLLRFQPKDGDRVLVRARVSLYEARGEFQLIVEQMEPAGEGALLRAFQLLKAKLEKEGLFDTARKKPIPPFPRCVGVVTSPTGAAIRDILQVMARRFPAMPVILYPTLVQGEEAPQQIVEALKLADARGECDLLILARGGGSLEDLAAFNDEALARAIAALETPLISAVGHETDFTIADFVADRRAPTPSAAAELATPDQAHIRQRLALLEQRLRRRLAQLLQERSSRLEHATHKLRLLHPRHRLEQHAQRLDELNGRLARAMETHLVRDRHRLAGLKERLLRHAPEARLRLLRSRWHQATPRLLPAMTRLLQVRESTLQQNHQRLLPAIQHRLEQKRQHLGGLARALQAVSPLQTLERGYSITLNANGEPLTDAKQVSPGDRIRTLLAHGELLSVVEKGQQTEDSIPPG